MTFGNNELGLHALCWVGGWSETEARQAIEGTARLGYDLIEIPTFDLDALDIPMTVRLLQEYGLKTGVSLGLDPSMDVSGTDPEAAHRGEAHLLKVVSIARDLGAERITGILYSGFQKYFHAPTPDGVERSAAILRRVCEAAQPSGITIGMEAVNRYETNLVNTAAQARAFCDMVGAPNIGVHLDTYHMNIEEADAEQAIVETGDQLVYFHTGDSHRGYLGSGSIDFAPIFRGLARIGYAGPITFESFSSEVVDETLCNILGIWRNLWSDSEDLCRHAIAYTRAQLVSAAAAGRPATGHIKGVQTHG